MTRSPETRAARLRADILAAVTLAAIAVPEQLATAQLAGVPAGQGIAVFAVASLIMAIFARNRSLSVGADSTIAPVLVAASAVAALPGTMALLAAMVGVILLAVVLFRLEGIARLLSMPVATGMMAGIATHIIVGRLPTALGLDAVPAGVGETLRAVWHQLPEALLAPLAMTVLVACVCLAGRALDRRLPAPLIAIAAAAGIAALIDPDGLLFRRSAGDDLSLGLTLPMVAPGTALVLLPTALTVAFLCLFQTTVVLREGADETPGLRRNAFACVGLSNVASAAIGGFAVNASPPRTEIVLETGASGQVVGLCAALIGLAVLLLAPGLLRLLPNAALAGVLVFVALHIFPLVRLRRLIRHSPAEAGIALATTLFVTILPLQYGAPLAILISLLHATLPLFAAQVVELRQIPGTTIWWHRPDIAQDSTNGHILVLGFTSPVNFANAEGIASEIRAFVARRAHPPRVLVLEGAGLLSVDMTGADRLCALVRDLQDAGIEVGMARVESDRAREQIARNGLLDVLGRERMFTSVAQAVRALS
jgi:SulP family sulfate permease